jgi:hypothetical protein
MSNRKHNLSSKNTYDMTEQSKEELDLIETSSGSQKCKGSIVGTIGQSEFNSDYNAEAAVSYNDTDLAINGHKRNRLTKKNDAEIKEELKNKKNPHKTCEHFFHDDICKLNAEETSIYTQQKLIKKPCSIK